MSHDTPAKLDSCAVSDALERHGLTGVVLGLTALSAARPIAGRVVTVRLGPAGTESPSRHLCTAAVDASGPGDVIVIANDGRVDCASWGGLLSTAAAQRGIEGIVIDGACRDVDEARERALPVYARAAVPVTARGRIVELEWGRPVEVDGVSVDTGDYVIADGSGVAFVPAIEQAAVLATAAEIVAREAAMAAAIKDGAPVSEVMGASYESLLRRERQG